MLLENFIISNVIFARRAIFSTLYIGTEHRLNFSQLRLQCFDAVGWAAGRASGL